MLAFDDDENFHPVGKERNWRESYYCNFVDLQSNLVGFAWQGAKENQGHGEAVFVLCDGKVDLIRSVATALPLAQGQDPGRRMGSQRFVCHEPWRSWSVHYDDGESQINVDWTRLSDACDWEWEDLTNSKHFQAAGKVHVTGVAAGRKISFHGYGERDRAWGARDYGPLQFSVFQTAQFPDDVALHSFVLRDPAGKFRLFGYLHKDGQTFPLSRCEATLQYDGNFGPPVAGSYLYVDERGREVELERFEIINYVGLGGHGDGAQLDKELSHARNLMFLTFQDYRRSDGVRGKGMMDLNVWPGQQQQSFLAVGPIYSTLYSYGRE
jgi:hypothetical protein